MRSFLCGCCLLALVCRTAVAAPPTVDRQASLVALCKVWSAVKFLDPQLMAREIDWDTPLIHAIPAARAAKTADESAAAVALCCS